MRPAGCNLSPETGFIKGNFMDEAQDMPPAEPDEDAKLMLRVRNGDASAMEMLVRKHQNSVYATVARMLNNGPETEDIAQQVFIRIWKGAGNYEPSARFTTWMFTILRNLVFNEVRRQKRKPTTSADAMEEEGGMAVFLEPSQAPDEALEHTGPRFDLVAGGFLPDCRQHFHGTVCGDVRQIGQLGGHGHCRV